MDGSQPKTVVVTGASRGIGRAIAATLADEGWLVRGLARGDGDFDGLAGHPRVTCARVDVAAEDQVRDFFAGLRAEGAKVDALVNNAGLQGGAPIGRQGLADWQRFFSVNVTGAWLMAKHALPLMPAGAAIVNVGSVASVAGFAERAAYCASKHALVGLTKALAAELAPAGVRVNILCLGSFDTPGLRELAQRRGAALADYAKRQLCGRLGDPDEASAACSFLLSDRNTFMNGALMAVDGGLLVKGALG